MGTFAYLLGHDSIDQWPSESYLFEKAHEAREALNVVLTAQPGAVGIVAHWDETTQQWMKCPDFARRTARQWWDSLSHDEVTF